MAALGEHFHGEQRNAVVGWTMTAIVTLGAIESALSGSWLWTGVALSLAIVAVLPALTTREWTTMVPWPILLLGVVAVLVRASGAYHEVAGYIAVAALALSVVVELDAFTSVDMSRRFAVTFAVMTTMAIQGLWTVAQYGSDAWLGTGFLRSQTELQWDFVIATAVGILVGGLFGLYLRRFGPVNARTQDTSDPT